MRGHVYSIFLCTKLSNGWLNRIVVCSRTNNRSVLYTHTLAFSPIITGDSCMGANRDPKVRKVVSY